MPIDPAEYRRVLGHFPTGVTVVTAIAKDGPAGLAIGSFSSGSLDPPLVMFCPSRQSASWLRMKSAGSFCVNVMAENQGDICAAFASSGEDKFSAIDWTAEATGAPVIAGSLAWIDCETHTVHDGGDHEIVVGEVKAAATAGDLDTDRRGPLLFFRGGYGRFRPAD